CCGIARPGGTQDDVIDDAVALGFFRTHEEVTLGVALDLLDRLAGVLRQDVVERLADAEDFLGMDLDVGGLALESTRRLMDQDAGVDIESTLTTVSGLNDHGDEGLGTPAEPFEIHGWLSCRHYRVQFLQSSLPRTHF